MRCITCCIRTFVVQCHALSPYCIAHDCSWPPCTFLSFRLSQMEKGPGIQSYYQAKIDGLKIEVHDRTENLRRLEAQRNDLNAKGAFFWNDVVAQDSFSPNLSTRHSHYLCSIQRKKLYQFCISHIHLLTSSLVHPCLDFSSSSPQGRNPTTACAFLLCW